MYFQALFCSKVPTALPYGVVDQDNDQVGEQHQDNTAKMFPKKTGETHGKNRVSVEG